MSFNVTYAVNNKIHYSPQNTLTVCEMGINEVVDLSCDLIEETNTDLFCWAFRYFYDHMFTLHYSM